MFSTSPPSPAMLYFDHNATHPLSDTAREAWLRATRDFVGNPSSPHRLGARAEKALDEAREKVAHWLGCAPSDIVWTSGATEAANAAIHHAAAAGAGSACLSAIEHPCVIAAARRHFVRRHDFVSVSRKGILDLGELADRLKASRSALVAVMAANNETGVLQPWREALSLCREHEVPFFCDAAQWIGKLPAQDLGAADFVSGCGHKFGGPQGVGFLRVPQSFCAQLVGGPQEEGRRAGTENVAGVLAMVAAWEECEAVFASANKQILGASKTDFEQQLLATLPSARILGEQADRLWNTASVVLPEIPDCRQRWVVKLDKLGFAVSTGSACSSGKEEISHVLEAMGLATGEASRVLRFSSGWETTAADWKALLQGVQRAYSELALSSS